MNNKTKQKLEEVWDKINKEYKHNHVILSLCTIYDAIEEIDRLENKIQELQTINKKLLDACNSVYCYEGQYQVDIEAMNEAIEEADKNDN